MNKNSRAAIVFEYFCPISRGRPIYGLIFPKRNYKREEISLNGALKEHTKWEAFTGECALGRKRHRDF